jgi:hypothetical protein
VESGKRKNRPKLAAALAQRAAARVDYGLLRKSGGHGGFPSVTANHSGVSERVFSTVGRRKCAATSSISNIPMKE